MKFDGSGGTGGMRIPNAARSSGNICLVAECLEHL